MELGRVYVYAVHRRGPLWIRTCRAPASARRVPALLSCAVCRRALPCDGLPIAIADLRGMGVSACSIGQLRTAHPCCTKVARQSRFLPPPLFRALLTCQIPMHHRERLPFITPPWIAGATGARALGTSLRFSSSNRVSSIRVRSAGSTPATIRLSVAGRPQTESRIAFRPRGCSALGRRSPSSAQVASTDILLLFQCGRRMIPDRVALVHLTVGG